MGRTNVKVRLLEHTPNPENVVAMAAKLCYSNANIGELLEKIESNDQSNFINGLVAMGHMSPIEHISFTFGIEGVSRAFLAQITRHRIASFSVKSQRYTKAIGDGTGTFAYILPPQIEALGEEAVKKYDEQMRTMQIWYNEWVEALGNKGESSNEDARFVLPNAAETKMIVTFNARELLHVFSYRLCNRAQWEFRAVADAMLDEVKKVAPIIFSYAGPHCVHGVCPEGKKSCGKQAEMKARYGKKD